jgi:hypothetical protein
VASRLNAGATQGYWEDSQPPWTRLGATSQVLRLDRPGGEWQVELETATGTMKLETLKELEFNSSTSAGPGASAGGPVRVLLAADYVVDSARHTYRVQVYVRDPRTGTWNTTIIAHGKTADIPGHSLSLRAVCVHRDRVTNAERVFLLVGTLGIFTGVFDPSLDGMIRWDAGAKPLFRFPLRLHVRVKTTNELPRQAWGTRQENS